MLGTPATFCSVGVGVGIALGKANYASITLSGGIRHARKREMRLRQEMPHYQSFGKPRTVIGSNPALFTLQTFPLTDGDCHGRFGRTDCIR
jgi:hypothetical protein